MTGKATPTCISLREDDKACLDALKSVTGISTSTDAIRYAIRIALRHSKRGAKVEAAGA